MTDRFLDDRRAGLEDAFFAQHNEMLRRKLVDADTAQSSKAALIAATGITDEAMLTRLMKLELGSETLIALTMVPMVLVAWADGAISTEERAAVLASADKAGIAAGSPSFAMLQAWLEKRPAPALMQSWKDYVHALTASTDSEHRRSLEASVMAQAHMVASATGSFLGLTSPISSMENAVLKELAKSFHVA